MDNKIKGFINEEVDRYIRGMKLDDPNKIVNVINELFYMSTNKLMTNIGSVEADGNFAIASENWEQFIQNLTDSITEENETWLLGIKNVKLKILTYKYFTMKDMIQKETLESYLRVEIKSYFTALQNYRDAGDFMMKFFQLPTNILFAMVRYLFFLSPDLNKSIIITNDDLRKNIERVTKLRLHVADKISKISNGYADIFDVKEMKDLYDNGILFEDNFINRAINEFVYKLTSHKEAKNSMLERFSGSMISDLNSQSNDSAAYLAHIKAIRNETGTEFFTVNGEQLGKKFDNELDLLKNKKFDGYIVNKESRLKEPHEKINTGVMPWEANSEAGAGEEGGAGPGGDMGGGSADFGGGDFGNADFGGDFAPPGSEGEIPGSEEEDGTPMPDGEDGLPSDFGTVEDNTESSPEPDDSEPDDSE